jgi:polysaccharide export outer membrane protein
MKASCVFLCLFIASLMSAYAADAIPTNQPSAVAKPYVLAPNDLVLVKVYRQDDLESRLRISADGTSTMSLLGTIRLAGKTLEEATTMIRELLAKDYLVNPQVTLTILEYAKRRFTVLGQVQKPGTYEIPSEESVTVLEAIAMAGGFNRLANTSKITITRSNGTKKSTFVLDAKSITADGSTSQWTVLPEDTITIPQRIL